MDEELIRRQAIASAVYPLCVPFRAEEKFGAEADKAFKRFAKAAEK